MTHEEAIDTLLAKAIAPAARASAEQHVSACKDCWDVVRLLCDLVAEPEADSLYGCKPIREKFYLLSGLAPEEARRRHPDVARHVGWCQPCRSELLLFLQVEREAAQGIYDEDRLAQLWTTVTETAERIHIFVTELVVHVSEAAASFRNLPVGLVPMPIGQPVVYRSLSDNTSVTLDHVSERLSVTLGDSGPIAHLTIEPRGADQKLRIIVEVEGARGTMAVTVREALEQSANLVAAQSMAQPMPFIVEVAPGRYVVDLWETEPRRRFKFTIDVRSDDRSE